MSATIINVGVSEESTNISWHVCSASSSLRPKSAIFPFLSPFFSPSISLFYFVFLKTHTQKKHACHFQTMPGWFSFTPIFIFFYHGGFTNVHWRFGDERDEIIPIPALPLSRSNSLTKLSDSILAPTARVNLLCHLQSTRGSTKSHSSPCQSPPTAFLFRSMIQNCILSPSFSLHSMSVCLYFLLLSPYFSLSPSWNLLYLLLWKHCWVLEDMFKANKKTSSCILNAQFFLTTALFVFIRFSFCHGCLYLTIAQLFICYPCCLPTGRKYFVKWRCSFDISSNVS